MQKLPKILPHIDIITETSKKTELYSLKLTCLIFGTVTRSPFPVDIVKISAPMYFISMFSVDVYECSTSFNHAWMRIATTTKRNL